MFLGDMTDIFHSDVPWEFVNEIFEFMADYNHLIFQLLTKRPGRMAYFAEHIWCNYRTNNHMKWHRDWPPNIWAGTSVEMEWDGAKHLVKRLDCLARVPAKVRFVSVEPMLGTVDLREWLASGYCANCGDGTPYGSCCDDPLRIDEAILQWGIVGGESGPGFRPMEVEWVQDLSDQFKIAGIPLFVKQAAGPWPGRQGRLPDALWKLKEMPSTGRSII